MIYIYVHVADEEQIKCSRAIDWVDRRKKGTCLPAMRGILQTLDQTHQTREKDQENISCLIDGGTK